MYFCLTHKKLNKKEIYLSKHGVINFVVVLDLVSFEDLEKIFVLHERR